MAAADEVLRRQLVVTSPDGEPAHAIAPHVVRRVAVALREAGARLEDPAATKGCAFVTAVAHDRPLTLTVGRASEGDGIVVRMDVMRSAGARAAVIAMPITLAASLAVSWFAGGRALLVVGLLGGAVLALGVGMAVFFAARRSPAPSGADRIAAARIHRTTLPALTTAIEALGLDVAASDGSRIGGVDDPLVQASSTEVGEEALQIGDEAAWTRLMRDAVGSVAPDA